MTECPHCSQDLGDLEEIMNQLAQNKLNGNLVFTSSCCGKEIKAFSKAGFYYIAKSDDESGAKMIGAA